jgi:hypothetical protein
LYGCLAELTPLAEDRVDEYIAGAFADNAAKAALAESAAATETLLAIVVHLLDLGVPQIDAEDSAREAIAQLGDAPLVQLIRRAVALYEHQNANTATDGQQSCGTETSTQDIPTSIKENRTAAGSRSPKTATRPREN